MTSASRTMLSCRSLNVRFGGVEALSTVDVDVLEGSITSIIGPNGAGKTTLFNAVTGLVPLSRGAISFREADITALPPHKRGQAGIVRTFQNLEIFHNMNVLENVMTGTHRLVRYSFLECLFKTPRYFRGERECRERSLHMLEFVGLKDQRRLSASELPFGNQRLLELARALAADPVLLLLDEPAAGLNIRETRRLGELIVRIREEFGMTIVLVEHDMDLVMDISDRVTVLSFGKVLASGTPAQIQKHPEVIAAYLGVEDGGEPCSG
jgi:branched-chain amino acid transport system ATP-binding protein